jgi:hypothetical protein
MYFRIILCSKKNNITIKFNGKLQKKNWKALASQRQAAFTTTTTVSKCYSAEIKA